MEFNCIGFNPDGHLLLSGNNNGQIIIHSLIDNSNADILDINQSSSMNYITFSNNGYHMASISEN